MPIERKRSVYISPDDDCRAALLAAAQAATTSLHLLVYGFTLADLGDVLIAKHRAGLTVEVVADRTQSAGPTQKALLQRLHAAGIPVVIATSTRGGINHEKVLLVDIDLGADANESYAVSGSYNYSESAAIQENMLQVDNDPSVCALLWRQYQETRQYGLDHVPQLSPTTQSTGGPP